MEYTGLYMCSITHRQMDFFIYIEVKLTNKMVRYLVYDDLI